MEERDTGARTIYGSARRLHIADIVKNEKSELPSPEKPQFAKVKIFGTVITRRIFKSEGKVDYGYLTVDDGSGSMIQVKAWGSDVAAIEKMQQGDMVDILGKVKQREREVYIIPEIIRKVTDPNWETVRELEMIEDHLRQNSIKLRESAAQGINPTRLELEILDRIESVGSNVGIEYSELARSIEHFNEEEIKKALSELLNKGIICEPRPGRYRK